MTTRRTMPAAWIILAVVFLAFMAAAPGTAAEPEAGARSGLVVSLDGTWLLAPDPQNVGRQEKWWEKPAAGAKPTKVPWIIQDAFPGYHGVAWYWRDFTAPANPHVEGRYLLRFWAVDYLAEVWLNGVAVGGHEGGEGPFVLDVTAAIKPGQPNLLAVRVLNPTNEPIDGIALPLHSAAVQGGAVSRRALVQRRRDRRFGRTAPVPPVRVADLWVRPDAEDGQDPRARDAAQRPGQAGGRASGADRRSGCAAARRCKRAARPRSAARLDRD